VIIMLPFSLLGRKFFRRISDGNNFAVSQLPEPLEVEVKAHMLGAGPPANGEPLPRNGNNNDVDTFDLKNNAKAIEILKMDGGYSIV